MLAPRGCGSRCHGPSERRRGAPLGAGEGRTLTRTGIPGGRGTGIRVRTGRLVAPVWLRFAVPLCRGRRSRRGPGPLLALMSVTGTSPTPTAATLRGAGAGGRGGRGYLIAVAIKIPADARPAPLLSVHNAMPGRCGDKRGAGTPDTQNGARGGCPWAEHGSGSAHGSRGITAGLVALAEDPGSGAGPRFRVL